MHDQVITSLAILKANWDSGFDYIENFVPFVAECLRAAPRPEVSMDYLQQAMIDSFGLKIPQSALKTILKRTVKRGYAHKMERVIVRNDRSLARLKLAKVSAEVLRQHEALVRKLVQFCNDCFQLNWSHDQASASLLSYISNRSTPLLALAVRAKPIPDPLPSTKQVEFVLSKFTLNLFHNDAEGFKFLETLVKGSILASALLYPEMGEIRQRFEGTEIYFDTPFLMRAIGSSGPNFQSGCRELIELLYEQNASLKCFQHTRDEMYGVLDAAARALRHPSDARGLLGATVECFISLGYQPSDVELLLARLDKVLKALHIEIKPKPAHDAKWGLDEVSLGKVLCDEVHYRNQVALNYDVDSLTAAYRLRHGESFRRIEACKALFVTTNANLARASRKYFREKEIESDSSVPICVLDDYIGTLAWLKNPASAPQLPRQRIIADSYAAVNPSDALWRRYLNEIDRLQESGNISEDDYHLLRYSTEAKIALMELTFGDDEVFVTGTVEQILDRAKAAARAETEALLRQEKALREEAEKKTALAQKQSESQIQAIEFRIVQTSSVFARWFSRVTFWVSFLLLMLGAYFTLPHTYPESPSGWVRLSISALLGLTSLFSLYHLVFGTSLRALLRRLEVGVSHFAEKALRRQFFPKAHLIGDGRAFGDSGG
jgi:hypothetical protein